MKSLVLNSQASIPMLGFGTWQLVGDTGIKAVAKALGVGYRHIDTADRYGNHKEISQAIELSSLKREDLFITTKIPNTLLSREDVFLSVDRYLQELNTNYIDLLLIHWPNKNIPIAETLGAMRTLKEQGKVKAIGVSNFTIHHLKDAKATGVEVTNNQIELHPTFNQKELREYCAANNIVVTAYSPLGRGQDIGLPLFQELVKKYNSSPAQVILNWILQLGCVAIPKSEY
ncbi:MAG: aldo/keto reductase [Parcubacteria group bacterium Greene0714_21]|nr:MAG: aldo/keto reductase [Parcubacteria group bacterium Greene0416_39]TSC97764.1 MAG: aldo/keto reductase [Parcubacteria group bacterium Greene1014_47]TSD04238.1 MAG: aldo/keto reductase [Parcubacteria group bacterium Greene0714_21]